MAAAKTVQVEIEGTREERILLLLTKEEAQFIKDITGYIGDSGHKRALLDAVYYVISPLTGQPRNPFIGTNPILQ